MKPIKRNLCSLALLLFTGCATKVWYSDAGPESAARDFARCRNEAQRISNPLAVFNGWAWLANEGDKDKYTGNCMIAKGYTLVNRNSVPNGERYPREK